MKLKLHLTDAQFRTLHTALDTARSTTKEIKVPREALAALLLDHSALVARVGDANLETAS